MYQYNTHLFKDIIDTSDNETVCNIELDHAFWNTMK